MTWNYYMSNINVNIVEYPTLYKVDKEEGYAFFYNKRKSNWSPSGWFNHFFSSQMRNLTEINENEAKTYIMLEELKR